MSHSAAVTFFSKHSFLGLTCTVRRFGTSAVSPTVSLSQSSIDPAAVSHLGRFSEQWWDNTGQMKPLHSMNMLRVPLIRDGLLFAGSASKTKQNTPKPLHGVKLIDVGCGGGLLSEPLARLGADVTGIDASAELVDVAKNHAKLDSSLENILYRNIAVEMLVQEASEQFDAVVVSEVIEHVQKKSFFLEQCINLLKPHGSIFLSTLNRTTESWLLAIIAAEQVLQLVPKGTHEWNDFITPQELQIMLERYGCSTKLIHGMCYNPLTDNWSWTKNTSISYAIHAVKNM